MQTTKSALAALAVVALLVLAGCASPVANGTTTPAAPGDTPADGAVGSDAGTVQFYISDEKNAIDDFEHLNVTVTKIGLHRVGDADGAANDTAANGTATPSSDEDDDGEWVEYEVERTVDLTELKGPNATKLDALAAPNGSYDKVFVYVDGIDATLNNGESVNVKLPSSKLQINKGFTVGNGENVSFVFDLSVHKAGKSGKYILKPVISESGTSDEVDIEDVDERDDDERDDDDEAEKADDENDDEAASDLSAEFQGPVRAGEQAKLKVTGADGPVANATVTVNGETVGTTDASGSITFTIPEDAEEVEVTVTKGDAEVELTREPSGGGNPALRQVA